jgi:cation-transporting P-type ATPase E
MIMPPDVAVTGLTELAVRARTDAGQVNRAPPVPGRSLLQILRANVLTRFNAILGALAHRPLSRPGGVGDPAPAPVLAACAGMVLAAIAALTMWRRWRGPERPLR